MPSGEEARSLFERLARVTSRAIHTFDRHPTDSDAFLRRLLRNLPGMAYRCLNDRDWTMDFVSTGCRALTGFDPSDLVDNRVASFGTLIHPDDREHVWEAVQRAVESGRSFEVTYRIRRADGAERRVWEQGCAVIGDGGDVEALEGFIADITDSADLRARVWDRDAQLRALSDQGLAGVYLIQDGRFRHVNPFMTQTLGYEADELLSMPSVLHIVAPGDRERVAEHIARTSEGAGDGAVYEFEAVCSDGSSRHLEAHGHRIDYEGGVAVMGLLLDVTARRAAQRRYHEAQKMEALGRMATGVAHDLNNFLGAIRTSAELLLLEHSENGALTRELYEIVSSVERGAGLSRQLMEFGRATDSPANVTSVGIVLEDLVPMLDRAVGSHVTLKAKVQPDLPDVCVGYSHLQQIVTNLVLNAGDAIPVSGTVRISAFRAGPVVGEAPEEPGAQKAPEVSIEVRDDGVGMAAEVRQKIFEPYFTTKGDDGTGLGLANVWRIVDDAGGRIQVESTAGAGTTFRVVLPARGRTR